MKKLILVFLLINSFEIANADSFEKCIVKSARAHDSDHADTYVTFELSCEKHGEPISTESVFAMSDKTVAILLSAKANKSPINVRIDADKYIRFVDLK